MGRMLIEAVTRAEDCTLGGALDMPGSPGIGLDASGFLGTASGVTITSDVAHALPGCHALIDFTRPEGTMAHLAACRKLGVGMVIGTTGFTEEQKQALQEASKDIAIMLAPNMSVGVNVTLKLLAPPRHRLLRSRHRTRRTRFRRGAPFRDRATDSSWSAAPETFDRG